MKTTFLFVLMILFFASCGDSNQNSAEDTTNTDSTATTITTNTGNTENTATTPATSGESSLITDATVKKVCDCFTNSKSENGDLVVSEMRECMGGNMIEFIAKLLPNATEKQKADAEQELNKKTEDCFK